MHFWVREVAGWLLVLAGLLALAGAIAALLRDVERAQELGQAGRVLAQEKFSIETNVRALARILAAG